MLRAGMKVSPYVRRGDRERRRARVRVALLLTGFAGAVALLVQEPTTGTAQAEERRSLLPWVEVSRSACTGTSAKSTKWMQERTMWG